MPKGDLLYLGHMLDVSLQVVDKVEDKSREDFDEDENLRLALTHLIQIIGEAARRVSLESRLRYPFIPWTDIIGMRNKVFTIIWTLTMTWSGPLLRSIFPSS